MSVAEHDEIEVKMRALERLEHSMREGDRAFGNNAGIDADAFYATSQPDYWRDTQADELGLNYESGGIYAVLTKVMPEESMVTSGMGQQAPEAAISPNNVERILGPYQTKAEADAAVRSAYNVRSHPRRQTETAEFQIWFGDSKVVDANGKPLVVMHASTYGDISEFKKEEQRFGKAGFGFYFSDASGSNLFAEYGDRFQMERSASGEQKAVKTYPVYLSLQNPLVVDHVDDLMRYLDRGQKFGVARGFFGNLPADAMLQLQRQGYDGIITRETTAPRVHKTQGLKILDRNDPKAVSFPVYVAFESTQIKSAIGNNGQFDPDNTDIRFSRAPGQLPLTTGAVKKLQDQLAAIEAEYEPLRKRKAFGAEWSDVETRADAVMSRLRALTGDPYGKKSVKAKKPSDALLNAEYLLPTDVPKDVRVWIQKNAGILTSDATDAVRWGRITDTLKDDRYPSGELTIYRAVADGSEIRAGDWVTTDRKYAEMHLSKYLSGKGEILEETVNEIGRASWRERV